MMIVFDWKNIMANPQEDLISKFSETRKMIQVMLEETQDLEYGDVRRNSAHLLTIRHYQMTSSEYNLQSMHKFMFQFFFGSFENPSTKQMEGYEYDLRTLQNEGFLKMNRSSPILPIPLSKKRWNSLIRKYGKDIIAKYTNVTGYFMYPLSRSETMFIFQKINTTPVICGSSDSFGCWGGTVNNLILKYKASFKEFFDNSPTDRFAIVDFKKKAELTKSIVDEKSVINFLEKQKKSLENANLQNPNLPQIKAILAFKETFTKTDTLEADVLKEKSVIKDDKIDIKIEIPKDEEREEAKTSKGEGKQIQVSQAGEKLISNEDLNQTESQSLDENLKDARQYKSEKKIIVVQENPIPPSGIVTKEDIIKKTLTTPLLQSDPESTPLNLIEEGRGNQIGPITIQKVSIDGVPMSDLEEIKSIRTSQLSVKVEPVIESVKGKLIKIDLFNESVEKDLYSQATKDFIASNQSEGITDQIIESKVITHYILKSLKPYIKQ